MPERFSSTDPFLPPISFPSTLVPIAVSPGTVRPLMPARYPVILHGVGARVGHAYPAN